MMAEGGEKMMMTKTGAVADQIKEAARRSVVSLKLEALLSVDESNYTAHKGERDRLCRRLAERDLEANELSGERNRLAAELEGAREELRQRGGRRRRWTPPYPPSVRDTWRCWPSSRLTGWTRRPVASAPRSPTWPG